MPDKLLSFSEVLLFGRLVDDLLIPSRKDYHHQARVATTETLTQFQGLTVDGITLKPGDKVLVHLQNDATTDGIYTVEAAAGTPAVNAWTRGTVPKGEIVRVSEGEVYKDTFWQQKISAANKQKFKEVPRRAGRGLGRNKLLEGQLANDARLARIYGFSYEGGFYEIPAPAIFLVHGPGVSATEDNLPYGVSYPKPNSGPDTRQAARAPLNPDVTGVVAADFQFSNDIMYWPYDKADYSIRMDVMSGQLEQILLDVYFELEAPNLAGGRVAGGRVAGGRVAGGRVAGGRVAGGRVAGGRVSGGRVSGSGD